MYDVIFLNDKTKEAFKFQLIEMYWREEFIHIKVKNEKSELVNFRIGPEEYNKLIIEEVYNVNNDRQG